MFCQINTLLYFNLFIYLLLRKPAKNSSKLYQADADSLINQ